MEPMHDWTNVSYGGETVLRNTYFGTALAFEWLVHVPLGTGVEESH